MKKKAGIILAAASGLILAAAVLTYRGTRRESSDARYENILCLGIDKEVPINERQSWDNSYGSADAVFLLSLDKKEKKARIVAIPRDTMVEVLAYPDPSDSEAGNTQEPEVFTGQIALQFAAAGGQEHACRLLVQQVSKLLGGIPVSGYVAVNLKAAGQLNDLVGGVDYTFEHDYTFINPFYRQGATVHLQGKDAVEFLHLRDTGRAGTAEERIGRLYRYVRLAVPKVKEQILSGDLNPAELPEMLQGNWMSDYGGMELAVLAAEVFTYEFSESDMYTLEGTIDTDGIYEEFYPDQNALKKLVSDLWK